MHLVQNMESWRGKWCAEVSPCMPKRVARGYVKAAISADTYWNECKVYIFVRLRHLKCQSRRQILWYRDVSTTTNRSWNTIYHATSTKISAHAVQWAHNVSIVKSVCRKMANMPSEAVPIVNGVWMTAEHVRVSPVCTNRSLLRTKTLTLSQKSWRKV